MPELTASVWEFLTAGVTLAGAVLRLLSPWLPVALLVIYALWLLDWQRLRPLLARGGWVPGLLLALGAAVVWTVIDRPEGPAELVWGLSVGPFVAKFMGIAALIAVVQLCGALQLAGVVPGPGARVGDAVSPVAMSAAEPRTESVGAVAAATLGRNDSP